MNLWTIWPETLLLCRWAGSPNLSCVWCSMALEVYVAVPIELKQIVVDAKCCRLYYLSGPGKHYVGLRQRKQDAVERAKMIYYPTSVNKETHIFLKTTFTAAGFAKYATLSTDHEHNFVPKLHKKVYYYSPRDWQVWRWNGDLPLAERENGEPLIWSEWVPMD